MNSEQTSNRTKTLTLALLMLTSTLAVGMSTLMTASASHGDENPYIAIDFYEMGGYYFASIDSHDLNEGDDYDMSWNLRNEDDMSLVANGTDSWTGCDSAGCEHSSSLFYYYTLQPGEYCINANLQQNDSWADAESACVVVSNAWLGIYWNNANAANHFDDAADVSIDIVAHDLIDADYLLTY